MASSPVQWSCGSFRLFGEKKGDLEEGGLRDQHVGGRGSPWLADPPGSCEFDLFVFVKHT